MYIILLLILCSSLSTVTPWKYQSTFEAYIPLDGLKIQCMSDCVQSSGKNKCVYDWKADEKECVQTSIPTKKYRTIGYKVCVSDCGLFDNKDYQWCATGNSSGWDYCNRIFATTGRVSHRTTNIYVTCKDECTTRDDSYNWCHTVVGTWERCNPTEEVMVFNYRTSDIVNECSTPCKLYKEDDNLPHCYDNAGKWKKCYLNPSYDHVLKNIDRTFKARCKKRPTPTIIKRSVTELDFSCSVDVEDVATGHEDNNPTMIVRTWDARNPITDDQNPVLSYTLYPTPSYFEANEEVNLPLVLRAVITAYTVGRPRDIFTSIVNRNYNNMGRNIDHDNYDERGHIIAARLGGPTEIYNIFPQAWGHNRGSGSPWFYFETLLDCFMRGHTDRYAIYTAVLSYGTDENNNLQHRPTAVALRIRLYINSQLVNVLGQPLNYYADNVYENLYFTNDPDYN